MTELRRGQPQQLIEIDLPGGGVQQIPPPHHLIDLHGPIVVYHRQLIGIHPVGPADNEVSAVFEQVFRIGSLQFICKANIPVRYRQTPGGTTPFTQFRPFTFCQVFTLASIDHLSVAPVGGRGGQTLRPGAETGIDQALLFQFSEGSGIQFRAVALGIGAVGASLLIALVPVQIQPAQIVGQLIGIFRPAPVRVQVLHPQHHGPPGTAHRQPGQQRGKQVAQVHPSAGTGGKPPPQLSHASLPFLL